MVLSVTLETYISNQICLGVMDAPILLKSVVENAFSLPNSQ